MYQYHKKDTYYTADTKGRVVVNMQPKIKLKITKELQEKTILFCKEEYVNEWSGVVFVRVAEGDFKDLLNNPDSVKLEAFDAFPCAVGSPGYTEFKYSDIPELMEYMVDNDYFEEGIFMQKIHSHNSMPVFYSGTDDDDLYVLSKQYMFYASLVTNNKNEWFGKIAIRSNRLNLNWFDGAEQIDTKAITAVHVVLVYDLELDIDVVDSNPYSETFSILRERKKAKAKVIASKVSSLAKPKYQKALPAKTVVVPPVNLGFMDDALDENEQHQLNLLYGDPNGESEGRELIEVAIVQHFRSKYDLKTLETDVGFDELIEMYVTSVIKLPNTITNIIKSDYKVYIDPDLVDTFSLINILSTYTGKNTHIYNSIIDVLKNLE